MDYNTAKKLKENGFPNIILHTDGRGDKMATTPTLSELIEACGDGFQSLCRYTDQTESRIWVANWYNYPDKMYEKEYRFGETPETAVANLWLQLKKESK
jgi:hypothetical protein